MNMKLSIIKFSKLNLSAFLFCLMLISCSDGVKDVEPEPVTKVERTILQVPLLAGLPVENRAIDPEFYLREGLASWFFEKISPSFDICEDFSRVTYKKLPAGRHALSIKGSNTNLTGCIAWGAFILGLPAAKVSVWVAHEQQTLVEEIDLKISYFDPQEGNENVYQQMLIDESSLQTTDGIEWYQFEGVIPASAQGWADIQITHNSNTDLLINGLVVQDIDAKSYKNIKNLKSFKVKVLTNAMKDSLKNREKTLIQSPSYSR
jgi:hypothetical protein